MILDSTGIAFLKAQETTGKPELTAYRNKNDVWTIGYGNTYYENGTKVKQGDKITAQRAEELFYNIFNQFSQQVTATLKKPVTQNQFNALVSYAYNRGIGEFRSTKLLAMVNQNPNNPAILSQFAIEWGTNQTYKNALIARRKREAILYSTGSSGSSNLIAKILIIGGITFLTYKVTNS